jgi:hypothetical protein
MSAKEWLDEIAGRSFYPDPVNTPDVQVQMDALPEYRALLKIVSAMLDLAENMEKDAVWLRHGDEGDRAVAQEIRGDADKIRDLVSYYLNPARMR